MNKERIVIIGANEFQKPLIEKAKEMGFETHVFSWEHGAKGKAAADYFYPVSIVEKEKIYNICKNIKPVAVITIASDLAAITVQYIAERLGLPCNSSRCIEVTTDKYKMRMALKKAGIYVPQFQLINKISDLTQITLPCIVKPVDRSGSRAITKVNKESEWKAALDNAVAESFLGYAIAEEFMDGEEYSCESITYNGKHEFIAITKKFTTGAPSFVEIGHVEPSGLDERLQKEIYRYLSNALDALGVTQGASHIEFRLGMNNQIKIIEIGARMGGDFIGSDIVELSTGYDFVKNVIKVACGECMDTLERRYTKKAAVRFVFSKEDDRKVREYIANGQIRLIRFENSCEDWNTFVKDSSGRKGCYILELPKDTDHKMLFQL